MKKIMGILNLTPDSFFEPSRYNMSILDSGADIIDIGAYSTRPGHQDVPVEEEWKRLEPVLEFIALNRPDLTVSIDTFRSEIVSKAYGILGKFIVNDVYASEADPQMLPTVSRLGLEYIAMHHTAAPDTQCVIDYFRDFAKKASELGINWILDPGFGFGKTVEENWNLLGEIHLLKEFGREILVGVSMKRMTGHSAEKTQEANLLALKEGADILRVHDVEATRETVRRYYSMTYTSSPGSAK